MSRDAMNQAFIVISDQGIATPGSPVEMIYEDEPYMLFEDGKYMLYEDE